MATNGLPIPGINDNWGSGPTGTGGSNLQALAQIIKLIQSAGNRNPTAPLNSSNVGGMITNQSTIPGANIPPVQKQFPNTRTMPDTHNKNVEFGTLMSNVGEIVKTAEQNHEAKKARDLQVDLERVMIAAQNPNDPQNAKILNDIMNDPKKRKAISQALGINFLGQTDTRKPFEKQAVQAAANKIKQNAAASGSNSGGSPAAGNPQSQAAAPQPQTQVQPNPAQSAPQDASLNPNAAKFMSSLPRSPQLSPQYQVLAQAVKDGLIPSADVEATQNGQNQRAVMAATTKLAITQALIDAHGDEIKTKQATELLKTDAQINGKTHAAEILANAQRYKADQTLKGEIYRADQSLKAATIRVTGGTDNKDTQNDIKAATNELNAAKLEAQMIIGRKTAGDGFDKDAYNKVFQKVQTATAKLQKLGVQVNPDGSAGGGNNGDAGKPDTGFDAPSFDKQIGGSDSDDDWVWGAYKAIYPNEEPD